MLQCQKLQSNCQIAWKEYKQVPFQIIGYNGVLYDVRAYTVTVSYNHSTRISYQKSLFRSMTKLHWLLFYQIIRTQFRHMQEKVIFINHGVRKSSNMALLISLIMPCHYDWTTTCDKAYVYFYIQCLIHICTRNNVYVKYVKFYKPTSIRIVPSTNKTIDCSL